MFQVEQLLSRGIPYEQATKQIKVVVIWHFGVFQLVCANMLFLV